VIASRGLNHLNLNVSDVQRSLAFYEKGVWAGSPVLGKAGAWCSSGSPGGSEPRRRI
jgi:hypothetical protein